MRPRYKLHECFEVEVDMLDALRKLDASQFTVDEDKADALEAIKADLHSIDEQLRKLCLLKPESSRSYIEQHRASEDAIAERIVGLKLINVR